MNKTVVEAVKLAVSSGASFILSRAIAKAESIQKMQAEKMPGVVPAVVTGAMFGATTQLSKTVKDKSILAGLQAGTGAATIVQILNIQSIKKNLPNSVQGLLAGDPNPNLVLFKPEELERAIGVEAERLARQELAKAGFGDQAMQIEYIEEEPETDDTVNGERDTDIYFQGDEDIYFHGDEDIYGL